MTAVCIAEGDGAARLAYGFAIAGVYDDVVGQPDPAQLPPERIFVAPADHEPPLARYIDLHDAPLPELMYASPYTVMLPPPWMSIVFVVPLQVVLAPSRITDVGLLAAGAPLPFSFRNDPCSVYVYWLPDVSATDVTTILIEVGVPEQLAVGEHDATAPAKLDAMARSLTRTPFLQARRRMEVDTRT